MSSRSAHIPKIGRSRTDLGLFGALSTGTCTSTLVPSASCTSSNGLKTPFSYVARIVMVTCFSTPNCSNVARGISRRHAREVLSPAAAAPFTAHDQVCTKVCPLLHRSVDHGCSAWPRIRESATRVVRAPESCQSGASSPSNRIRHSDQVVGGVEVPPVHHLVKQFLEILFVSLLRRHIISFPEIVLANNL